MSSLIGNKGMGAAAGLSAGKTPTGYKLASIQNFTPEQMQLFKDLFSQINPESALGRMASGDQSQFEQMEAPALRQFNALQGNLASRFSGMGLGGRKGSGFQLASNSAAQDFAEKLQSQRMNLQQQALHDLWNMSNQLLAQRPYEQFLVKKQRSPSFLESILGGSLPIAGAAAGGMFGGPAGAVAGGQIGSSAAQGYFGNY